MKTVKNILWQKFLIISNSQLYLKFLFSQYLVPICNNSTIRNKYIKISCFSTFFIYLYICIEMEREYYWENFICRDKRVLSKK